MPAQPSDASIVDLIRGLASTPASEAADRYRTAMRDAYWERRDLAVSLAIGWAAVDRCFTEATAERSDRAGVHLHLADAKGFLYDIASFTWPGWDEAGIAVTPDQARLGLDAARHNLALALELDKDDLPMSRAHWMVGAHLLTSGDLPAAKAAFDRATDHAERADSPADAALAAAFGHLSSVAMGDGGAEDRLESSLGRLASVDDGAMFADQVAVARRVIER